MSSDPRDPFAALLADAPGPRDADATGDAPQAPLPMAAGADDPLADARLAAEGEAPPKRKASMPSGVAVILLVALVAIAALVAMRQLGLGVKLDFVNVDLNYPVEDGDALTLEHEKILRDLDLGVDDVQVPLENVQKNPFEIVSQRLSEPEPAQGESPSARLRRELAERRRRVDAAFAKLRLNSVLAGSVPVARISGQTVRVGDTIEDAFIVRAIHGRSVELESTELPGAAYTLALGEAGEPRR